MPIDPSIALQVRPPTFANPLETVGQALSLRSAMQGMRAQELQIDEAARQRAEAVAVRQVIAKYNGDLPKALPELYKVAPSSAMQLQKTIDEAAKAQRDSNAALVAQTKARLELVTSALKAANPILQTMRTPEGYATGRQALGRVAEAVGMGNILDAFPEQYSPEAVETGIQWSSEQGKQIDRFTEFAKASARKLGKTVDEMTSDDWAPVLTKFQEVTATPTKRPDVGTLERFITDKYGANATPAQQAAARRAWAELGREDKTPAQQAADLGDDGLKGLKPAEARIVKLISEYKYPVPTGRALSDPYWKDLLQRAAALEPSFDWSQYTTRQRVRVDFATGKASNNIRSLNTAVGHLSTLKKAADELGNASLQTVNEWRNWWREKTGDPRIVRFRVAANAVENELASLFKGTGATDQEIKAWRSALNEAQSPEQLNGAIDQAVDLLVSRLEALQSQYETGMGKVVDFEILNPKSRKLLEGLGVEVGQFAMSGGGGASSAPPAAPGGIPDGTPAVFPDGSPGVFKGGVAVPVPRPGVKR